MASNDRRGSSSQLLLERTLSDGVLVDGHSSGRSTHHSSSVPGVEHAMPDGHNVDIESRTVQSCKIYAISDVHCEQAQNMQWIKDLEAPPCHPGHVNVLLAAGDIATGMKKLKEALESFKEKFQEVIYVPGNHELWSSDDSLAEMQRCFDCCLQLGVRTKPLALKLPQKTLFIMPLQSWYHHSWDKEPDLPADNTRQRAFLGPFHTRWGDFSFCKWPNSMTRGADWKPMGRAVPLVARKMASLNTPWLKALEEQKEDGDVVVSLSHFLPRMELLPEKRFLLEPNLTKVSGSDFLRDQVVGSGTILHVFGHTHIPMDIELDDGIRYVQWCLGSKHEVSTCAAPREDGPAALWDSEDGLLPPRPTHWSDYYRANARDTSETALAPWVEKHLEVMKDKYGAMGVGATKDKKRPPAIGQVTKWHSFTSTSSAASTPASGGTLTPSSAMNTPMSRRHSPPNISPKTPEGRSSGLSLLSPISAPGWRGGGARTLSGGDEPRAASGARTSSNESTASAEGGRPVPPSPSRSGSARADRLLSAFASAASLRSKPPATAPPAVNPNAAGFSVTARTGVALPPAVLKVDETIPSDPPCTKT